MSENESYSKFINSLITTVSKFSLYPAQHPIIKSSIKHVFDILQELLTIKKELTFSLSSENKLLVEDETIVSQTPALLNMFIDEFQKLEAESITFLQGLTIEELEPFLTAMSSTQDNLKSQGGIIEILTAKNITHIKLNLFSYIKVDKDKEVITVENDTIVKSIDLEKKLKELLASDLGDLSLKGAREDLYALFLESPQKIIDLIRDLTPDVGRLKGIFQAIGEFSANDAKIKEVKDKVNFAKSLARFSSLLKKLTTQFKDKDTSVKAGALIDEMANKYTDEILVEAITAEFSQNKGLDTTVKNIIKKFFPKTEDRGRILSILKDSLAQTGAPEEDLNSFISDLESLPGPGKKAAKIDQEEFERLKSENAQLQTEVEKLRSDLEKGEEGKKQHTKVVAEKERMDNIFRHMAEGLVVVDSQGKMLLMNPAAEKLLNVNKDEAVGKPLRENIKEEHLLTFTKNLNLDQDGNLTKEIELVSQDESTKRVLRTSSAVVENQEGQTVGMVTVLNDITRQKEIEKLKSDFVALVSHELRTPLVVIQHSLTILTNELNEKLNSEQGQIFNNAQNNILRLRNLINDLLDIASIEAGKMKLKLELFDINEIAQSAVEFLDKWAKVKNITLEAQTLPSSIKLMLDKDRIIQVITNLVGNAIKFTPEGGKISVVLSERIADEKFKYKAVEVSIIDNGPGIEQKDFERIFNKFEQTSITKPGGTGLGLTIAKEIVLLHKGNIWVESELGRGSKFSFLLPKNREEAENG